MHLKNARRFCFEGRTIPVYSVPARTECICTILTIRRAMKIVTETFLVIWKNNNQQTQAIQRPYRPICLFFKKASTQFTQLTARTLSTLKMIQTKSFIKSIHGLYNRKWSNAIFFFFDLALKVMWAERRSLKRLRGWDAIKKTMNLRFCLHYCRCSSKLRSSWTRHRLYVWQ